MFLYVLVADAQNVLEKKQKQRRRCPKTQEASDPGMHSGSQMACSQAAPFQPLKGQKRCRVSPKKLAVVQALGWIMLRGYYVAKTNTAQL